MMLVIYVLIKKIKAVKFQNLLRIILKKINY